MNWRLMYIVFCFSVYDELAYGCWRGYLDHIMPVYVFHVYVNKIHPRYLGIPNSETKDIIEPCNTDSR